MKLYDSDYYEWARETADALRRGEFSTLDIASLVEEVEDLGKRERAALESRLAVLLAALAQVGFSAVEAVQKLAGDNRIAAYANRTAAPSKPQSRSVSC
jgi:hypothetical protein